MNNSRGARVVMLLSMSWVRGMSYHFRLPSLIPLAEIFASPENELVESTSGNCDSSHSRASTLARVL
ncbi:hypothetical protein D3C78_1795080 [compost metagenome]